MKETQILSVELKEPHWFTETEIFKSFLEKYNVTREIFTCNGCGYAKDCEFAWGLYNIHGDCLGIK